MCEDAKKKKNFMIWLSFSRFLGIRRESESFALFEEDICVCDLAETLGMTVSAVSHQLKTLKQAKLIGSRREGKQVIYFLADDHVRTIIGTGLEHLESYHR